MRSESNEQTPVMVTTMIYTVKNYNDTMIMRSPVFTIIVIIIFFFFVIVSPIVRTVNTGRTGAQYCVLLKKKKKIILYFNVRTRVETKVVRARAGRLQRSRPPQINAHVGRVFLIRKSSYTPYLPGTCFATPFRLITVHLLILLLITTAETLRLFVFFESAER